VGELPGDRTDRLVEAERAPIQVAIALAQARRKTGVTVSDGLYVTTKVAEKGNGWD
jgi:hypothetical protein